MILSGLSWQVAVIGLLAFGTMGYQAWAAWKRRQLRQRMVRDGKLQAKARRRRWNESNIPVAVVGIGSAGAFFYLEPRYGTGMAILILSPFFMVGVVVSVLIQRAFGDSVLYQAERLVRQKQVDQAVACLREAVKSKETADRSHTLSVLLLATGVVDEAVHYAQRAVDLGAGAAKYQANKAMVLAKAGDLPAALQLMASIRQREPQELLFACHYCHLLADAGRYDEAHEQLRQAEEIAKVVMDEQQFGESYWLGEALLEECRKRLGGTAPRGFPVVVK